MSDVGYGGSFDVDLRRDGEEVTFDIDARGVDFDEATPTCPCVRIAEVRDGHVRGAVHCREVGVSVVPGVVVRRAGRFVAVVDLRCR